MSAAAAFLKHLDHWRAKLPPEILGQVYERSLAEAARGGTGVYYTPPHVVDYLVKNTVGELLAAGTKRAAQRPLRILDPACGCGAFLLGAYQYLLDWHRDRRLLTRAEKKRILLGHIYGVDLDPQAVEVTKFALVLKLLQGEIAASASLAFVEHTLADLGRNIKCGDALIGPDFGRGPQRIRSFDWQAEFPGGGFDVVLGNPPYLSYSGRQAARLSRAQRDYFAQHYCAAGWRTAHGMFIELAVRHLARRMVAFIVPDQVGHLDGYGPIRALLSQHSGLREVRYWGEQVFQHVITPALTFIADKTHRGPTVVRRANGSYATRIYQRDEPWTDGAADDLLAKLRIQASSLGKLVADPGVHTGNCAAKLVRPAPAGTPADAPVLEGRQVSRYRCDPPKKVLRLDYRPQDGEYFTIRPRLKYAVAQFVIRQTAAFPIVGPREHTDYFRNSLLALYAPIDGTDIRYLVGLLNSRLLRYVYRQTVPESRQKAFPQVKVRSLRALPIRTVDPSDATDRDRHDRIVALVSRMLELHHRLSAAKGGRRRATLQHQADAADRQIDQLVYALYGLTVEEISQVETAL